MVTRNSKSHRRRTTRAPNQTPQGRSKDGRRDRSSRARDRRSRTTGQSTRSRRRDSNSSSQLKDNRRRKLPRNTRNKVHVADYSDISDNSDDDLQISGMTTLAESNNPSIAKYNEFYSYSTVIELEQAVTEMVNAYEKIIKMAPDIETYWKVLENKSDLPIGIMPAFSRYQLKLASEVKTLQESKAYPFLSTILQYKQLYKPDSIEPIFEELIMEEDEEVEDSFSDNEGNEENTNIEITESKSNQECTSPILNKNKTVNRIDQKDKNYSNNIHGDDLPGYESNDSTSSNTDSDSNEYSVIDISSEEEDDHIQASSSKEHLPTTTDYQSRLDTNDNHKSPQQSSNEVEEKEGDDDIIVLAENGNPISGLRINNPAAIQSNSTEMSLIAHRENEQNTKPQVTNGIISSQDIIFSSIIDKWPPPIPEIKNEAIKARVFIHQSALSGQSYLTEEEKIKNSYERLEFLGDSVINSIMTTIIYKSFPNYDAGQMTRLRVLLVSNRRLEKWAYLYGLQKHLLIRKSILNEMLNSGSKVYKIYADLFEAYVGGLVEDDPTGNMPKIRDWLSTLAEEAIKTISDKNALPGTDNNINMNAKTQLEKLLAPVGLEAQYVITNRRSSKKSPFTVIECRVANGQVTGIGKGRNYKIAEQIAAGNILEKKWLLDKLLERFGSGQSNGSQSETTERKQNEIKDEAIGKFRPDIIRESSNLSNDRNPDGFAHQYFSSRKTSDDKKEKSYYI